MPPSPPFGWCGWRIWPLTSAPCSTTTSGRIWRISHRGACRRPRLPCSFSPWCRAACMCSTKACAGRGCACCWCFCSAPCAFICTAAIFILPVPPRITPRYRVRNGKPWAFCWRNTSRLKTFSVHCFWRACWRSAYGCLPWWRREKPCSRAPLPCSAR